MSMRRISLMILAVSVFAAGAANAAIIEVGSPMGTMFINSDAMGQVDPIDENSFRWTGSMTNSTLGWGLDWDLTIDTDPSISGVSAFTNLMPGTANFTFNISALSTIAFPTTLVDGASTITVLDTNANGADMAALAGDAIYESFINATVEEQLFADPFALNAPANGVDFDGTTYGPQPGVSPLAIGDTFGINHEFSLTSGDQATVNSRFNIVPEPATIGLLLLGGACAARRRRSA